MRVLLHACEPVVERCSTSQSMPASALVDPLASCWPHAGITQLRMSISPSEDVKRGRLALVARLAPHLKCLCLCMGTQASQEALHTFFQGAPSMPLLQSLHLSFSIPQAPRRGIWPIFFYNVLPSPALAHVTELACCGSGQGMPSVSISVSGSKLVSYRCSSAQVLQVLLHSAPAVLSAGSYAASATSSAFTRPPQNLMMVHCDS